MPVGSPAHRCLATHCCSARRGVPAMLKSRRSPDEAALRNLPVQLTSFVGRRRDVAAVRGLLTHARLVTLTGAAGVGKTRLALRVAEGLRRQFADGVWLVELASLTDARLVPRVIASTLGQRDETAVSPDAPGGSATSGLVAMLRSRQALLILDSCEH